MSEAAITINGIPLTVAQSMAVRVACTTLLAQCGTGEAFGEDADGTAMAAAYSARLSEVLKIMLAP